jgi:ribosomal protein S8
MGSLNYLLANMGIGYKTNREYVLVKQSTLTIKLLKLLYLEGFIMKYVKKEGETHYIRVYMKYYGIKPALTSIKRVSKGSRFIYKKLYDLQKMQSLIKGSLITNSNGIALYKNGRIVKQGGKVLVNLK